MNKNSTLLCFLRHSNNQAQRLAGRDLIAIMAPSTIFLLWFWLTKVKLLFEGLVPCSCKQQWGGRGMIWPTNGPSQTSVRESKIKRERLEKIERIEKEDGRGLQKKFTLPMTNLSRKFAMPAVIHCHSYLESRLLWSLIWWSSLSGSTSGHSRPQRCQKRRKGGNEIMHYFPPQRHVAQFLRTEQHALDRGEENGEET